jgi:hypothetical protein
MKKWRKRKIKRLKRKIEELEAELEDARWDLTWLEDEDFPEPVEFSSRLECVRERHPVARITRYEGFGDIDSPEFSMKEESEEIPWTRYYREVRRSALQEGIKRIPRRFILSQFEQDVPPETAAQIARKNVENGQLKAVIIDGTEVTQ